MAAKTTSYDGAILALLFNATSIANVAQNGTAPLTNIYVSLHTSSPGVSGTQQTNEAQYLSYARQAVVRTSSGWTITGGSASPVANITFPTATSGSETETYFGIGSASSGAGVLYYLGPVSPSIAVSTGVQPVLLPASTIVEQ